MEKLVIVSPLPPTKSGIADYVSEQIPELQKYFDITAVVADTENSTTEINNVKILKSNSFLDRIEMYKNVPIVYHIGNNIYHEHCLQLFKQINGIIVLHDYCLHHLVTELTLARNDFNLYRSILKDSHGELGAKIADNRKRGIYNELIPFIFPSNRFLIQKAKGIVVHSNWALTNVEIATNNKVLSTRIPMHYKGASEELDDIAMLSARQRLELSEDKTIFISVGFITPPKQIQLVLKVLGKIKEKLGNFEYVLVGEPHNKEWLDTLIIKNGLEAVVRVTGFVSLEDMQLYIGAADFALCLRYPSAGETSATLMRCLGLGLTSVVFNYSSYSDFPDDVVYKIKLDTQNLDYLGDAIIELSSNESLRREYKERITKYVHEEHNIQGAVKQYVDFIEQTYKQY